MTAVDPVVDRARAFLDSVMLILKKECPGPDDRALPSIGPQRWVAGEELGLRIRRYTAIQESITVEQQCGLRMLGELRDAEMPELLELERALAADPVIGPRLAGGSVHSFAAGGGSWGPPVHLLMDRAIENAGGFDLEPSVRDELTKQWAEMLQRPSDQITRILALSEFEAPVPILLESNLEIDELSDGEIAGALTLGAGGLRGFSLDERTISSTFGVRQSFDSQLFIDEIPPAEAEREQAMREELEARDELVVLALRVFKAGRVGRSGSLQYTRSWGTDVSPVQGSFGPLFGWHAGDPYTLSEDEVPQFQQFWSAFARVSDHQAIESALHRFSLAADRGLPDDEIVDLMIAAEALFLKEIDESYRGELQYRLSARAASLLGTTLTERLQIFRFMKRAYRVRSVIVHGSSSAEADLRGVNGDRVSVEVFADDLEGVLRESLRAAISLLAAGKSFPPDWEELMLAGPRMS